MGYVSGLARSVFASSSFFSGFWYRATETQFLFSPEHIALTVGGHAKRTTDILTMTSNYRKKHKVTFRRE